MNLRCDVLLRLFLFLFCLVATLARRTLFFFLFSFDNHIYSGCEWTKVLKVVFVTIIQFDDAIKTCVNWEYM